MTKSIRVCSGSVFKPSAKRPHIVLDGAKRPWENSQFFSSDQSLVVIGQLQKRCNRDSGSFLQNVQSSSFLIPILVKKVFVATLL